MRGGDTDEADQRKSNQAPATQGRETTSASLARCEWKGEGGVKAIIDGVTKQMEEGAEASRLADEYPDNWDQIATRIKAGADFRCERCYHPHDPKAGFCLTVHHLVPIKSLCEDWNLVALCQRCHLSIQARVNMFQEYMLPHSEWFIPHLEGFVKWRQKQAR